MVRNIFNKLSFLQFISVKMSVLLLQKNLNFFNRKNTNIGCSLGSFYIKDIIG